MMSTLDDRAERIEILNHAQFGIEQLLKLLDDLLNNRACHERGHEI